MKKRAVSLIFSILLSVTMALSLVPAAIFAEPADGVDLAAEATEVPREALYYKNGEIAGIRKDWFRANFPDCDKESPAYLKLVIPADVSVIASNAFCTSNANYDTNDRYNYIHASNYRIVSVDFSQAEKLTVIKSQAFMHSAELSGEVTLPDALTVLEKYAFGDCPKLTGVYLPAGLKELGKKGGGSVFKDCAGLRFVRVKGSDSTASVELPDGLEQIGQDTFSGAMTAAEPTPVTIPASVTYIGDSAFETDAVTVITVLAADVSGYHGKAFISKANNSNSYGLGKRMTVFQNAAAYQSLPSGGLTAYRNSLTYEFTLQFGEEQDAVTQQKLCNQPPQCVKAPDGSWSIDTSYTLPPVPPMEVQPGYIVDGWNYEGKLLTVSTVLKPEGDLLIVTANPVLQEPEIVPIVDGSVQEFTDTSFDINVSNDKEHQIGVSVSHPLLNSRDQDGGYVKFEYEWTDVWKGGSQGPRMEEDGFGRYNLWDKPDVTNTISINGPEHERTHAGDYSAEDYGDGYYLVEIYGYYCQSGKASRLFYKSASTVIWPDPERTTDTGYIFYVKTSVPAEAPSVSIPPVTVEYGYQEALLDAEFTRQDGYSYTLQWYQADAEGQTENGTKIDGAVSEQYSVEAGKAAGTYYYYLEVTASKAENGDAATISVPVALTVKPKMIQIVPDAGQKKYTGQPDPAFSYTAAEIPNDLEITGALSREEGETAGAYAYTLGTLAVSDDNYQLVLSLDSPTFEIKDYQAEAIFSPEQPDGENGWYRSEVTVTPPEDHLISLDGEEWSDASLSFTEYEGTFTYYLKSIKEDETKGAVAANQKELKIDTIAPVITGVEDGKTYCIEAAFTAADDYLDTVLINGEPVAERGEYGLADGKYTITAADLAGNSVTLSVTVNKGHTPGERITDVPPTCTIAGKGHTLCTVCEKTAEADLVIDATDHNWTETERKEPTCTEDGYADHICQNDPAHTKREALPAAGHEWEENFTIDEDPTETEPGSKSIHCKHCDAVKDVTEIPALGSGAAGQDGAEKTGEHNIIPLAVLLVLASLTSALALLRQKGKTGKNKTES